MTWNYRLVRRKLKTTPGAESEYSIAIHEVFYNETGKPDAVTVDPVGVVGETVDEVREAYVMMAEAFQQPVLDYESIARDLDSACAKTPDQGKIETMKRVADRLASKREAVTRIYLNSPVFKRPLRFGDTEQIAALNAWRVAMSVLDTDSALNGGLARYEIEYTIRETRRAVVIAQSGERAAEVLLDEEPDAEDIEAVTRLGDAAADDEEGVKESDIH